MNPTFVCQDCDRVVGRAERIEVRREYRDINDNRRHTILLKKVCRSCADIEEAELRPVKTLNIPDAVPQALFGGEA